MNCIQVIFPEPSVSDDCGPGGVRINPPPHLYRPDRLPPPGHGHGEVSHRWAPHTLSRYNDGYRLVQTQYDG